MSAPKGKAASLWPAFTDFVKCLAGRHELEEVRSLAPDTVPAECARCGKRWAVKGLGDWRDVLIPWSPAAEEVYDRLAKLGEVKRVRRGDRVRAETSRKQQATNVFTEN